MKTLFKYFSAILLSFICSNILFAQSTFENVYTELGNHAEGLKIKQTENGNLIVAASIDSIFTEIIFDQDGNILNKRSFTDFDYRLAVVDFTNDDGYLLAYYIPSGLQRNFFVLKLDNNLNIVWSNYLFSFYNPNLSYFFSNIISTSDNKSLVTFYDYQTYEKVIYLDEIGNTVWERKFNYGIGTVKKITQFELLDKSFLIGTNNSVIKISQTGDSLWSSPINYKACSIDQSPVDSSIYVSSSNGQINKLSNYGILISKSDPIIVSRKSTIKLFYDDYLIINLADDSKSKSGNVILNNEFSRVNKINSNIFVNQYITKNDIFYGVGIYGFNLALVSGNKSDLEQKHITILSPNGNERFPIDEAHIIYLTVSVSYQNISELKIEFSSDNGISWQTFLIDNELTNTDYNLDIPVVNSDQCLIKVSDPNDPSVFDISYSSFSVSMYRYYNSIAANECKMWIGNMGMSSHNPVWDDSGFFWPGGENASIPSIFADGILWGGIHNGMIKVNGATYRYGLMPGAILEDGSADEPSKPEYSVFKLKKNWQSLPVGGEKDLMEYNYNNWPGEHGVPYIDVNNDGIFSRGIDEPKILGDETLFYVANDLDSQRSAYTYGSPPIGLEFQQTLFAYNTPKLKDAVFKKVKLINKSNSAIVSMYISYWMDDDLGYAGDDFVGCDTLLNLAYTYNGDNNDEDYYGVNPPAVGHIMLQGPKVIASKLDTAEVDGKRLVGYKNLHLNTFTSYIGMAGTIYEDPTLGRYDGTLEMYNNMKGFLWNGDTYVDPITRKETKFILSGDPVEKTGWYEGEGWPGGPSANDRRSLMSSGPFTMDPGDTQEVVYAIFMARGTDNIQSVAELKKTAEYLQDFWGKDFVVSVKSKSENIPTKFSLSQNYPNPFNPSTTIEYSIPSNGFIPSGGKGLSVQLIVYDVLGREVITLVNQKQTPGNYKVTFASHSGEGRNLASGIYFYQLKFGNLIDTKKMILLK